MTGQSTEPRKVRWTVPAADTSVNTWLNEQADISQSVRLLIREPIERDGFIDVFYKPVVQLPRRGRPSLESVEQHDDEESVAERPIAGPAQPQAPVSAEVVAEKAAAAPEARPDPVPAQFAYPTQSGTVQLPVFPPHRTPQGGAAGHHGWAGPCAKWRSKSGPRPFRHSPELRYPCSLRDGRAPDSSAIPHKEDQWPHCVLVFQRSVWDLRPAGVATSVPRVGVIPYPLGVVGADVAFIIENHIAGLPDRIKAGDLLNVFHKLIVPHATDSVELTRRD
ncbi:hypothetical protein AB0P17_42565 [Streptomyces sp. NPDC088124]|uniref:hypothetical protein n=1 Tax=Streptomyces sp. NPDC088124 TaxID=3154654 RepID=UPI003425C76E